MAVLCSSYILDRLNQDCIGSRSRVDAEASLLLWDRVFGAVSCSGASTSGGNLLFTEIPGSPSDQDDEQADEVISVGR